MKKVIFLIVGITFTMLIFSSCDKDDPIIPNEGELITTLNFTLTPQGGGTAVVLSFRDLDGDGGDPPVISGGTLDVGTTYSGSLELLNELTSPTTNISQEIEEESAVHQFFFQSSVSGLNIAYGDMDANGNPIGLESIVIAGAVGTGTLSVILRHEPDKFASGVAAGDITNAGGETDIEISFDLDVQ